MKPHSPVGMTTSYQKQPRTADGRFATVPNPEGGIPLDDVRSQFDHLDPHRIDDLMLDDETTLSMSSDLISHLRNSQHVEDARTWQDALNAASNATPNHPGAITLDVYEDCFGCGGSGLDRVIGGDCMDCSGTRKILASRSLRISYAGPDS